MYIYVDPYSDLRPTSPGTRPSRPPDRPGSPQVASVRIARGSDEMLILGTDGTSPASVIKESLFCINTCVYIYMPLIQM